MKVTVTETFFSVDVADMQRATDFYASALGATVSYATPAWTSIHIARVRIGLFLNPGMSRGRGGLHFAVDDLEAALKEIERCGGRVVTPPTQVAPGVIVANAADTEGNEFALRRS